MHWHAAISPCTQQKDLGFPLLWSLFRDQKFLDLFVCFLLSVQHGQFVRVSGGPHLEGTVLNFAGNSVEYDAAYSALRSGIRLYSMSIMFLPCRLAELRRHTSFSPPLPTRRNSRRSYFFVLSNNALQRNIHLDDNMRFYVTTRAQRLIR